MGRPGANTTLRARDKGRAHMGNRTRRDRVLAVIATAGTLGGLLTGVLVNPALAAGSGVTGTVATNGLLLNVRTGPSTTAPRKRVLPQGTKLTLVCGEIGQKIQGKVRTTDVWDRLTDGAYVSDAYIARSAPVPRCGPTVGQVSPQVTRAPKTPPRVVPGWVAPIGGGVGSGFRTKDRPTHDGVDIAATRGTPIRSAAAGTVITSECNVSTGSCDSDGSLKIKGCGWYVEIQHADRVVTRYCHMVRKPAVSVGQRVRVGQVIGYVGTSGNSSGPHLHFEVHTTAPPATRTNAVEPTAFLRSKGVVIAARIPVK